VETISAPRRSASRTDATNNARSNRGRPFRQPFRQKAEFGSSRNGDRNGVWTSATSLMKFASFWEARAQGARGIAHLERARAAREGFNRPKEALSERQKIYLDPIKVPQHAPSMSTEDRSVLRDLNFMSQDLNFMSQDARSVLRDLNFMSQDARSVLRDLNFMSQELRSLPRTARPVRQRTTAPTPSRYPFPRFSSTRALTHSSASATPCAFALARTRASRSSIAFRTI